MKKILEISPTKPANLRCLEFVIAQLSHRGLDSTSIQQEADKQVNFPHLYLEDLQTEADSPGVQSLLLVTIALQALGSRGEIGKLKPSLLL